MVIFAENDQTAIELEQWSDRSRGSRARPKTPSGSIFLQVSLRLIHFRDHSIIPPLCLLKGHAYLRAREGGAGGGGTRRRLGRLLLLFPAGPATPLALALALLPLIVLLHIEHADVARDRPDRACREGVGKRFQPRLVPGARLAVLHEEREVAFVVRRPIARFVSDGQRLAAEEDPLRQPRPRRTVSMPALGI